MGAILYYLLLAGMAVGQAGNPAKVVQCTPGGARKPSLVVMDEKGKCPEGYRVIGNNKDGKGGYCVNVERPKRAECKEVVVPSAGGGKK